MKTYDVTSNKNKGGWDITPRGGQRSSAHADTKQEAVRRAAEIAKNQPEATVVIHKRDGTFQEERTSPRSSDPIKSKG